MNNKKILVPVDFTRLSDKVIEHAATIGMRAGSDLVLLHCADRSADLDTLKIKLAEKAVKASRKFNITCDSKVRTGNIYTAIPEEADDSSYYLTIIGTHGVKGLRQKLLGADILRLVTKIPGPTLVVQSSSDVTAAYKKIILPVATHQSYENILKSVVILAKIFQSEVLVYSIERPGFKAPEQLKKNLQRTVEIFDSEGIKHQRINEKQTVLSVGFATQTLQFAVKSGAQMLAVMSVPSEEYHYFAQQDKENLLTNREGIPVLCASNQGNE